jgi:hypothetical protein
MEGAQRVVKIVAMSLNCWKHHERKWLSWRGGCDDDGGGVLEREKWTVGVP